MKLDPAAANYLKLAIDTIADQAARISDLNTQLDTALRQLDQVRSVVSPPLSSPFPSLHAGD